MTGLYLGGWTLVHLTLTLLPIVAGLFVAMACGVTARLPLAMFGLSAIGVLSAATFWVYLLNAAAGHIFAVCVLLACLVFVVLRARTALSGRGREILRPFAPPTLFFLATVILNTAFGYLRGGMSLADLAARYRYRAGMPVDNKLPLIFAQQLHSSVRPLPARLIGPWQASDRPPLQTGVYLLQQGVLGHDPYIHYQLVGIICQSFWVFGVWAFCVAARMANRATALTLAVIAFSGFAILNTFYTWPKLFPAAYLMLAAAALLTPSFEAFSRSRGGPLALGLTVGCALLGHPGQAAATPPPGGMLRAHGCRRFREFAGRSRRVVPQ